MNALKRLFGFFLRSGQDLSREVTKIDALRGSAALLVLVSHADAYYLIRYDPLLPYKAYPGELGVYLFFVLSGYLIWTSAHRQLPKPGGLFSYAVHRATRIMPLYYVALAFAILAFPLLSQFPSDFSVHNVVRHLTFTQDLHPSVARAFNPVLWTLTHEAVFYALVPLLFTLHRVFPVVIALAAFGTWWGFTREANTFTPFLQHCFLFAIGMTFAQYKLKPTWAFAAVALVAAILLGIKGADMDYISVAWALALLSIAVCLPGAIEKSLPFRGLAFAGLCSYSLYVWHYMLIEMVGPQLIGWNLFPTRHPVVTAIGFTALCLVVSWITYRLIEQPGQTTLRNAILDRRRGRQPAKSAA